MNIQRISDMIEKVRLTRQNQNIVYVSGGAPDNQISSNEGRLSFPFHSDYIDYLRTFGQIESHTFIIFGALGRQADGDEDPVLFETEEFFRNHPSCEAEGLTLLLNDQDEWFVLMNHRSGMTMPYDAIAKKFVTDMEKPLEDFIMEQLGDMV